MRKAIWIPFLSVALIAALVLNSFNTSSNSQSGIPVAIAQTNETNYAKGLSRAFESVAESITPSVVNVMAVKRVQPAPRNPRQRGAPQDPFFDHFRDFFGDDLFDRLFPQMPGNPEGFSRQGLGTGVIVSNDGYILTNNHVIGDADEINVRLPDQRSYTATLVGSDARTDLAVIKIDANNLTPARLGDSDGLRIGEWVLAAGNPFGLDNTVTVGIVSAKGRSIMGGNQFEDFIQTDAAINPGNSGGPLTNLDGEVVGINTAIFSKSGGYMGIGFAIPINMAKLVMNSLIAEGRVIRGWLGVGIQNVSEELARSFNYDGTAGALVGHIQPGSPAQKAGLKQGDIIVRLQGEAVRDVNELRHRVAALSPGANAALEIFRDGRKQKISVTIGELPGDDEAAVEEEEQTSPTHLGMSVETLTPELASRLRTSQTSGVIVTAVQPGSVAARGGIQRGDIILRIGPARIADVAQFHSEMEKVDLAAGVRFVVETQGMERFVFIRSVD